MSQDFKRQALLFSHRRFGPGGPHLLMDFLGAPLLDCLLNRLRAAAVKTCWLTVGQAASDLRDWAAAKGVGILDEESEAAALRNLAESTEAIAGSLLLMPAELPLIGEDSLQRLFEVVEAGEQLAARLVAEDETTESDEAPTPLCIAGPWPDRIKDLQNATSLANLERRLRTSPSRVTAKSRLEVTRVVDLESLAVLEQARKAEIRRRWLRSGVRMHDPASVWIDEQVEIGAGTTLGPGVVLRGSSRIGRNCRLGAWTLLEDAEVGEGSLVDHCSVIRQSAVGAKSTVGPFAHLRGGTRVGDRTRVGNFVEVKKSKLGQGTKAAHLAYVGDAVVGSDCNIGAGAITCNYDGKQKHQTTIGDGCFIGSDSQLIAPVTIGSGAYVAAGSTITEDVPAEALAIARGRQVNKPGWAKKK